MMVERLTDAQRAELRRLAEQATPGPWKAHNPDDSHAMNMFCITSVDESEPDDEDDLGKVIAATLVQIPAAQIGRERDDWKWEENTDYIAAANPQALLALLDELEATRTERDQTRHNIAYLVGQYHLLREVNRAQRTRMRYWIGQAATRRREALQQAADLVRRWHYRRGGYTELAHRIEQLVPSDAPPAGADAGAQQARVGLADALPGVVEDIMTGVQDEHVTLRDALPALQRWLRTAEADHVQQLTEAIDQAISNMQGICNLTSDEGAVYEIASATADLLAAALHGDEIPDYWRESMAEDDRQRHIADMDREAFHDMDETTPPDAPRGPVAGESVPSRVLYHHEHCILPNVGGQGGHCHPECDHRRTRNGEVQS